MCTFVAIGIAGRDEGHLVIGSEMPFAALTLIRSAPWLRPPFGWFVAQPRSFCFCGTVLGRGTLASQKERRTPKDWTRWSPGKQARWLAETAKKDAETVANQEEEAESWRNALLSILRTRGVRSVAVFHHFCNQPLMSEPLSIRLEDPIRPEELTPERLLLLPEDVALVIRA